MTAAPGPVCLRSGPLTLRPWAEPDASDVLAAFRDVDIALWNGGSAENLAAAREWVRARADWSDGSHASFAITATQGGGVLGSVSLHRIDPAQGDAEIGYWIAPGARRAGAAGRAVVLRRTARRPHRVVPRGTERRLGGSGPAGRVHPGGPAAPVLPLRRRPQA